MSTTPQHQPAMDRGSRRGSWARAFHKVRAAMKRRRSNSKEVIATAPSHVEDSIQESSHTVDTPAETALPTLSQPEASNPAITEGLPAAIRPAEQLLAVETGIEVDSEDDRDEPLLPMMSSRSGVSQDKARELFAKYGLQYDGKGKRAIQEPPTKIRRVEKPVRLRVHWTCHECRTQFGIEKTCMECGHRRCRDCTRHPPKRVKQISDDARAQMANAERTSQEVEPVPEQAGTGEPSTAIDRDLEAYQQEPSAAPRELLSQQQEEASHPKDSPRTSAAAVPGELSSPPLELDDTPEDNAPLSMTTIQYSLYTRPRAGVQTILKPKAQLLRRTCHKCETIMSSPSQTDCSNCGHIRCELCPRYPPTQQKWASQLRQLSQEEVPMVRTVQRVYRKPRQRVRYTCESCNTLFVDTDRCAECGHERCRTCHREPPKRAPVNHDPHVLEALNNRLAGYGGPAFDRPNQSIAASAG